MQAVVVEQARFPHLEEDAGRDPFLETIMGSGTGTELGGIQGFPLAAGAQDVEDGIGTDAVGYAGPPAAKTVGVDM